MIFQFTTTATCRPDVFRRTLESFRANLLGVDWSRSQMYLNVDPLPAFERRRWDVYGVAVGVFGTACTVQMASRPSFPAAVKWCWSQPTTKYFFHLEDDWELLEPVDIRELSGILDSTPALSSLTLRAYTFPEGDERICLSPGLFRTAHARDIAARLSLTANPERQLRPAAVDNPEGGKHGAYIGAQYPKERTRVIVRDIGRPWLRENGLRRNLDKNFTTWESVSPQEAV